VRPADEPEFAAAIRPAFLPHYSPSVGDVLDVLYDPGNHADVIVNPSAPDPFVAAMQSAGTRMASYAPGHVVINPRGGPAAPAPASSSAADQLGNSSVCASVQP
jgi:hypothetical protein